MYKFLLLLASLGSLAISEEVKHFDCGTTQEHAKEDLMAAIKDLHYGNNNTGSPAAYASLLSRRQNQISVDTYFHVITTAANANLYTNYQTMAQKQVDAMNNAYNPNGISFNLKGTTYNQNDAWAVGAGSDMDSLKSALRQGTYSSLNIYFHSDLTGGILGTCTMPSSVSAGATPNTYSSDGCNVQAGTMPGGSQAGYNQGMTAVHETGHWMGLFHTFEGYSCSGDGDMIEDTRVEATSTNGCPANKNSCPDAPGVDPIHNYMDYSTDACYEGFTAGQQSRMHDLWNQFRAGK